MTIFILDRALGVGRDSAAQSLHAPPPALQPIAGSINGSAQSANPSLPNHTGSATATATIRTSYRPHPATGKSSTSTVRTGKRKHTNSRSFDYIEDSSSEGDDANENEGDGSSSGESLSSNDLPRAKRLRTSRTTRSSARLPARDTGIQDALGSSPPAPVEIQSSPAIPGTATDVPMVRAGTLSFGAVAITTPILSADPRPTSHPAETTGMTDPPSGDIPRTNRRTPEDPPTEVDGASNEVETIPIIITETTMGNAEPELVAAPPPTMDPPITATVAPSPVSYLIDAEKVPAFLRNHGKGNRRVNIFKYLNELQDPHFQRVLFHYINFEANDKSNASGSLPTTDRPPEISQWTSRARPINLPEYTRDGRTFRTFVDSILNWWGSIQPPWRSFEPGVVSREVRGDWEALRAPRINGLLNVVILVYWWSRILEEHKPEDGVRANYEIFADDVAWVFSHLYT